jgi:hypothetical protein
VCKDGQVLSRLFGMSGRGYHDVLCVSTFSRYTSENATAALVSTGCRMRQLMYEIPAVFLSSQTSWYDKDNVSIVKMADAMWCMLIIYETLLGVVRSFGRSMFPARPGLHYCNK